MWIKLMAPALTSMVGLSLAAFSPQDGPTKEKATVTYRTEVKASDSADSSDALADVYDRLVKVRAMRLTDRPKKLADEAAAIYRQAVVATEKGEIDKAQGLTKAASELTRALEVSLKTSREQPSDPELPPPPRRDGRQVFVFRVKTNSDEIPPELRYTVTTSADPKQGGQTTIRSKDVTVAVPEHQATIEAKGDVRVHMISPENGQPKRDIILERRSETANPREVQIRAVVDATKGRAEVDDGLDEIITSAQKKVQAESEHAKAQAARAAAMAVHEDLAKQLNLQIKILDDQKQPLGEKIEVKVSNEMLDKLSKTESEAKLRETLAGIAIDKDSLKKIRIQILEKNDAAHVESTIAIARLKEAHALLLDARKAQKGEDGSNHLDAARDLYNSARREAEAKHFDRASELAKAAKSLAGLDKQIHEVQVKVYQDVTQSLGEKGVLQIVVGKPETSGAAAKDDKPESDEAGPIHGIGVQLSFEEGKGLVQDLIAGGPADKNGRIKPGDSIVGIETSNGATLGFADKTLVEVTKLLRGPIGSKIKVIVQPKGSTDRVVYEIERQQLVVPKPEASAKPEGGGDGALPPVVD